MKNQQGMTLISLLLMSAVVIGVAIVGIKTTPSVIEYFSIVKIVKAIGASGDTKGASVVAIRESFDRRANIDSVTTIKGADLDISKEGNEVVIAFEYPKKIPLVGNVSLYIDYSGSASSAGGDR